jgi:class 3 adenylate cyclase
MLVVADILYAPHGDVHLAYRMWGDGPPLLYVPSQFVPIVAMDEEPAYERFLARLASFSTLIVFDRNGIGHSDPMRVEPSIDDWAAQMVSVLDAAKFESSYIVAHGYGGLPAVTLAATQPERVLGLVLAIAASHAAPPEGRSADDLIATARPSQTSDFDFLSVLAPTRAHDVAFRAWWDSAGRRGASPAVAQQLIRLNSSGDVRPLASLVQAPTLVIDRPSAHAALSSPGGFGAEIPDSRTVEIDSPDVLAWLSGSDDVLAEIEEFVTGSRPALQAQRRLLAVMFTDIVGSTSAAADVGDDRWRDMLDIHDRVLRAELARHGGKEIDSAGDGFLSTFTTPTDAVRCARRLHTEMERVGLRLRIGLHCGEVEVRGENIAGIGVHLAARAQAQAQPGETLVTSTVREALIGSEFVFASRGAHELKGFPDPWELFGVA